jgi:hypothetical protein
VNTPKKPGGIHVTEETVYKLIPDADALALAWIKAWADKVPSGTQMILAKMRCALADGPCGCPEDAYTFKCTGPYPPVPLEILMAWVTPLESSPGPIPGVVEGVMLPAPQAVVSGGHVREVQFVGPGMALYLKKI